MWQRYYEDKTNKNKGLTWEDNSFRITLFYDFFPFYTKMYVRYHNKIYFIHIARKRKKRKISLKRGIIPIRKLPYDVLYGIIERVRLIPLGMLRDNLLKALLVMEAEIQASLGIYKEYPIYIEMLLDFLWVAGATTIVYFVGYKLYSGVLISLFALTYEYIESFVLHRKPSFLMFSVIFLSGIGILLYWNVFM